MSPSPRLAALYDAMVAAVTEHDAPARRAALGRAWHEGRGLEAADLDALSAVDDRSFFVYRHLVRHTLREAIHAQLPRTRALVGERFDADIDAYVSAGLPASRYLRDVAYELVALASPWWRADPTLPPFAAELAHYELRAFEASVAVRPSPAAARERVEPRLDIAAPVRFHESVLLTRYAYPVHELPEGGRELAPRPTALLVYRDPGFELRHLELSPLAADLLERLLAGEPLGAAITGACEVSGAQLSPQLLGDVAKLLADYAERGILLGAPSSSAAPPSE